MWFHKTSIGSTARKPILYRLIRISPKNRVWSPHPNNNNRQYPDCESVENDLNCLDKQLRGAPLHNRNARVLLAPTNDAWFSSWLIYNPLAHQAHGFNKYVFIDIYILDSSWLLAVPSRIPHQTNSSSSQPSIIYIWRCFNTPLRVLEVLVYFTHKCLYLKSVCFVYEKKVSATIQIYT